MQLKEIKSEDFMGNINELLDLAEGNSLSDVYTLETDLLSVSGNSKIICNIDSEYLFKAERKLNELKSMSLPKAHIEHIQLLDEYQSATIEGARTTIAKVLSGCSSKDDIMVRQSLAGLRYLLENSFSEENILNCWRIITSECCENVSAGIDGYRTGMVYVGNDRRIIHVPASPEKIPQMMNSLFNYSHESALIEGMVLSFYLVHIHPFADGNGRLSRVILQKKIGLLALPISKAIAVNLSGYYKALASSEKEINGIMDITPYCSYIFSIIEQACNMFELYTKPLTSDQSLLITKMDKDGKEYISYRGVSDIMGCNFEAAVNMLNELVDLGYLEYSEEAGSFKLIWR